MDSMKAALEVQVGLCTELESSTIKTRVSSRKPKGEKPADICLIGAVQRNCLILRQRLQSSRVSPCLSEVWWLFRFLLTLAKICHPKEQFVGKSASETQYCASNRKLP